MKLKDMFYLIKGGKSFEDFVSDYYEDISVERVDNYVYIDQDFYELWETMDVELICEDDEKNNCMLLQGECLLIAKAFEAPNRFDEDYPNESIVNFNELTAWEDVSMSEHLQDTYLGEILDYIAEYYEYRTMKNILKDGCYLSYDESTGEVYEESLLNLVDYSIEVIKDLLEGDSGDGDYGAENDYLDYLIKIKTNKGA